MLKIAGDEMIRIVEIDGVGYPRIGIYTKEFWDCFFDGDVVVLDLKKAPYQNRFGLETMYYLKKYNNNFIQVALPKSVFNILAKEVD